MARRETADFRDDKACQAFRVPNAACQRRRLFKARILAGLHIRFGDLEAMRF